MILLIVSLCRRNLWCMEAIIERRNFSRRLGKLLTQSGYPSNSPTWLAQEFNKRFSGPSVTLHAVRKWIQGESIPSQEKLKTLASWLGVSPEWLRYGELPSIPDDTAKNPLIDLALLKRIANLSPEHRQVVDDLVASLQRLEGHSG